MLPGGDLDGGEAPGTDTGGVTAAEANPLSMLIVIDIIIIMVIMESPQCEADGAIVIS